MNDRIPGTTWDNPIWYRDKWRIYLSSVASLGVSAALPAKALPIRSGIRKIGPPYVTQLEDIPFNLSPGAVNYVCDINTQHIIRYLTKGEWRLLNAGQPLDSRREPWHDSNAGDVPVQE